MPVVGSSVSTAIDLTVGGSGHSPGIPSLTTHDKDQDDTADDLGTQVLDIFAEPPSNRVVAVVHSIPVSVNDMHRLLPGRLVNDQIINAQCQLIQARDDAMCINDSTRSPIHVFNSFFLSKLEDNNYGFVNLRRWTRSFVLSQQRMMFMPFNKDGSHWALVVVNLPGREITYYDSLHYSGAAIIGSVLGWVVIAFEHNYGVHVDVRDWQLTEMSVP
ncbi:hypothetical protein B484DRAFT_401502 [Ochromonadaceae sp. CCMP2298]|nr:hypothetical protein B484DRAFT_401502 [Ochromonadaceae sp. CCMP2298]